MLPKGVGGVLVGSEIQISGITTKRMDQLAPHLAHMGHTQTPGGHLGGFRV